MATLMVKGLMFGFLTLWKLPSYHRSKLWLVVEILLQTRTLYDENRKLVYLIWNVVHISLSARPSGALYMHSSIS